MVFEEALNMLTRSLEKAKAAFKIGDTEASRKAHLLTVKTAAAAAYGIGALLSFIV